MRESLIRTFLATIVAGALIFGSVAQLDASGSFSYSAGPVKAIFARTDSNSYQLGEFSGFSTLAAISVPVSAGTSTDLLEVSFSAECRMSANAGAGDVVRIRVVDVYGGITTPLEPYDGFQALCGQNEYATHKGNWIRRVATGTHDIRVQLWIFDANPFGILTADIDDFTFEVVVHD